MRIISHIAPPRRLRKMRNRSAASGNILFLILLAVILFAALSYAVTESLKGGGQEGMSKEAAKAAAAEILSWLGSVETAVQRMRVVKSIPDYQIDFKDPNNKNFDGSARTHENTSCSSTNCEVFHPNGGGAISLNFSKYGIKGKPYDSWQNSWAAPGNRDYVVHQMPNISSPAGDIVIEIVGINTEVCKAYNLSLGLSTCPTVSTSGTWRSFYGLGTAAALEASDILKLSGPDINTKATFCRCYTAGPTNQAYGNIYYTVVER